MYDTVQFLAMVGPIVCEEAASPAELCDGLDLLVCVDDDDDYQCGYLHTTQSFFVYSDTSQRSHAYLTTEFDIVETSVSELVEGE